MRALDRKLLRELGQLRAQLLAIVAVVATGIGILVAMVSTWSSLEQARDDFYEKSRFADVFSSLVRAPLPVAEDLAAIPGVEEVRPSIVATAKLEVPTFPEPIRGTIFSLREKGRLIPLDAVQLRKGRFPSPGSSDEVLVHEAFASAHRLGPGDALRAIIYGTLQEVRVVGVALSPGLVYQVTPGALFPDDARYGVLWMNEEALARAFDMEGAFNHVSLRSSRGAQDAAILAAVDRILTPWGGAGAYDRSDQPSHRVLTQELEGLRIQAVLVPSIFLGVAAFLLQLVLGRFVASQREIIAMLKAVGYRDRTIGLHYVGFVLVICTFGGLLGGALGLALGRWMVSLYRPYFRFPALEFVLQPGIFVVGLLVAVLSGLLAAAGSVAGVVRLEPAVAMRPPAPARFRPLLVDRLRLGRHVPMAARMVIRRLERRPLKALLSSLGIALSLAILLSTSALRGSIHRLMDVGFRQEQRQDVSLSFIEPQAEGALLEVQHLPGVLHVEPFRQVATRLRAGRHHENVSLLGLPPTGSLRLLLGADSQQVGLPPGGLLLSRELARRLGVTEGHELQVEVLEGKRPTRTVRIVGLIDDMLGLNAYISLEALHPLLGEGRRISSALATVDRMQEGEFLRTSAQIPKIAGVQVRATVLREFEETFAATQNVTTALLGFFASVITVGVVYNMARISLAESSREFASLRVLGFTRREIARIFFAELAVIVTGSLLPGVALGYGLAHFIAGRLPTEVYRLPIQIPGADLLRSVAIVAAAALATAIFVRRRLDRLDLIGVLKTRE